MAGRSLRLLSLLSSLGVIAGCLFLAAPARAQGAAASLIGLPLVIVENGWARYSATTQMGEVPLVVQVGKKDSHKKRSGRWFKVEIEVPEIGRTTLEYLIEGNVFLPKSLLKMRTSMSGQDASESDDLIDEEGAESLMKPKSEKGGELKVGSKTVQVTRFTYAEQKMSALWSGQVPGFGLVSVEGPEPMKLVDFGIGGDPWQGQVPQLPESIQKLGKAAAEMPTRLPPSDDTRDDARDDKHKPLPSPIDLGE